MHDAELPLLELFTRLHDAGLPLGIEEYQAVLRALQGGFGIPDREALARLCRSLWVKSPEDKLLFDYHFDQVMAIDSLNFRDTSVSKSLETSTTDTSRSQLTKKILTISPKIRYAVLGGMALVLLGYGGWFFGIRKECPYFTSLPVAEAKIDKEYRYKITVCQPQQNSQLMFSALKLPSWLKLRDNGNGTATLSGTPTTEDAKFSYLWNFQGKQLAKLKIGNDSSQLKFSPDGKYFANFYQGKIIIWNLKGEQLAEFKNEGSVPYYTFSADSQRLAIASDNEYLRQFDFQGNLLKQIKLQAEPQFSPDGDYFVEIVGKNRDTIVLRDLDGRQIAKWPGLKAVFASKRQYLATYDYTSRQKTVRLWDFQGHKISEFSPEQSFDNINFIDNDRYIIASSYNYENQSYVHKFSLWDIDKKELTKRKAVSKNYYSNNDAISPNGQYFATTLSNTTLRLWNLRGEQIAELPSQRDLADNPLVFSNDGNYFATFPKIRDGSLSVPNTIINLWDVKGNSVTNIKSNQQFSDVILSRNADYIATLPLKTSVALWNKNGDDFLEIKPQAEILKNENLKDYLLRIRLLNDILNDIDYIYSNPRYINEYLRKHRDFRYSLLQDKNFINKYIKDIISKNEVIDDVTFSNDKKNIITVTNSGIVHIWNLLNGKLLSTLNSQGSAKISPDGQYITTTANDNVVKLFNLLGRQIATIQHQGRVDYVRFSKLGRHLNTVSQSRITQTWDIKGNQLAKLELHNTNNIFYRQDGNYFVDIAKDGSARLYNNQGKLITILKSQSPIFNIIFYQDNQIINTYSKDGSVSLWNYQGTQLASLKSSKLIVKIIFSPDNKLMAARLEDGSVSLWDVRGNKLASLNSSKLINNIEFSPDSQTIATRLEDGSVILWDKRGNKLASLNSSKSITNIEFSPDSQKIATISEDRTISLWNINGKVITKFKIDVAYRDITFSPDSKILILDDSYYSNNVSFLDLRTNKLEKFQLNYFGAKKKYFVNITTDKIVYLWDFTGKQLAKISPSAIVKNVEFSYVQKYIIFTLKNNTIEIWDFKGNKIGALQPNKKINRIEFSRNGKNLATINYDEKVINLWSIKGEKIADIPSPYNYYGAVRFSKDGKSLAVYSNYFYFSQGYSVYLWDIKGNPIAEIKSEGEVKFSPDNKFFTTVSKDKAVEIWDFQGNKLAVLRNQGWLNAVEWSQDGRNLTTNAIISNAHLWDFQGNQLGKLPFENRINPEREKYEFSPNGEHLITLPDNDASASDETKKIARLWSLKGNQPAVDLSYQGKFNDKDFSPDGLHIATASGDGAVRLWDIQGNLVKVFWHQRPVETVRFSLDAKNLLTVTADGVGRIWDLRGNLVAELKHRGLIERLEFSPNQQNLLTISQDEIVQLWNLSDQKSIDLKHRGKISSIVFSLDGQTIATNSQDNVARLWNLQGKSIAELKHPDWVKTIIFSKDGKYLISTVDHTARVWNLKGRQLAELSHPGQVAGEMTFSPDGQHLITNSYDHSHKVVLQVTGAKREKSTQSFTITTTTDSGGRANTSNLSGLLAAGLLWSSVLLMGLSGSYVLFKWLLERRNQESLQSGSPPDGSTPPVTNDYSNETDDELQVAQAVRHTARNSAELTQRPFAAGDEYFPVTRRQMKQSWRYLRQFVRQGLPTELDIEATVKEVSRHGFLLKPVLVPRRVNRTELLLLIDQDGSMIPFHFLSRQLAETALHGGRLAKTSVYYFRNCPHQHLYHDPHHQEAETVNDVLASIHEYTSVMIFSDGGVARRGISPERVEMTTIFLEKLKQRVRYIVWLNPIPRSRWHDTTAEEIAKLVPMFEFNRRSLHEAINVLRGKPAHSLTQL